jgi:hypothetical protein
MIEGMSLTIWAGIGAICAVAMGIWRVVRRRGGADAKNLGGVSEQWMNEQRIHDHEWRRGWR